MINSVNDILFAIDIQQHKIGMSDFELSRLSGISRSTLSRWKTGERKPGLYQLLRVMGIVGLELNVRERNGESYGEQVNLLRS